jgi:hypothetical protein
VSTIPVPAHSNNFKYGGQRKRSFYTADLSARTQMTYVYAKEDHKKPAENFRDLCSAGTLDM